MTSFLNLLNTILGLAQSVADWLRRREREQKQKALEAEREKVIADPAAAWHDAFGGVRAESDGSAAAAETAKTPAGKPDDHEG